MIRRFLTTYSHDIRLGSSLKIPNTYNLGNIHEIKVKCLCNQDQRPVKKCDCKSDYYSPNQKKPKKIL